MSFDAIKVDNQFFGKSKVPVDPPIVIGGTIDNNRFKKKNPIGETFGCLAFLVWLAMLIPAYNHFSEKHPPRVKGDYVILGFASACWPLLWTFDIAGDWCNESIERRP